MFTYPPEEDMLMLTDIVPVDNNWINVPNEIILGCTVCDMTSLFSPLNCITMIDLQTITVEPLFRKYMYYYNNLLFEIKKASLSVKNKCVCV